MTCIFLDIDGTCADSAERFKSAGHEPKYRGKEYSHWLKKVQNHRTLSLDHPVGGMADLANLLELGSNLSYLTARSEIYRNVTIEWLAKHNFPILCPLYMRPKNNREPAGQLKERFIQRLISPEDRVIVIDDDYNHEVEQVCKRNGWTFLKARSGS